MSGETLTVAAVQCAFGEDLEANVARVERFVREAAARGAKLVLPPELFEGPYFCREEKEAFFERARPVEGHPTLARFSALAKELGVVLPVSFFERAGPSHYNSLAMLDADGALLGVYRKSHIPDGPGYEEKFYFRPGDTGFRVFATRAVAAGAAVCWDQWFPECARALVLKGADLLLYPTAIGSEPGRPGFDSMEHWRITMRGHAGANLMPVAAANRVGTEIVNGKQQTYYGSSFIAGPQGELRCFAGRDGETVLTSRFDRAAMRENRAAWGLFRDRRPDLYGVLTTLDGVSKAQR